MRVRQDDAAGSQESAVLDLSRSRRRCRAHGLGEWIPNGRGSLVFVGGAA